METSVPERPESLPINRSINTDTPIDTPSTAAIKAQSASPGPLQGQRRKNAMPPIATNENVTPIRCGGSARLLPPFGDTVGSFSRPCPGWIASGPPLPLRRLPPGLPHKPSANGSIKLFNHEGRCWLMKPSTTWNRNAINSTKSTC